MSWAEVKKINSNMSVPLDELIGKKTDGADANGSLHGKIKSCINDGVPGVFFSPSSDVLASSNAEVDMGTELFTDPRKCKEVIFFADGVFRISFNVLRGDSVGTKVQIYRNGEPYGEEFHYSQMPVNQWATLTRDMFFLRGDRVELRAEYYLKIKNFKVMGSRASFLIVKVVV